MNDPIAEEAVRQSLAVANAFLMKNSDSGIPYLENILRTNIATCIMLLEINKSLNRE